MTWEWGEGVYIYSTLVWAHGSMCSLSSILGSNRLKMNGWDLLMLCLFACRKVEGGGEGGWSPDHLGGRLNDRWGQPRRWGASPSLLVWVSSSGATLSSQLSTLWALQFMGDDLEASRRHTHLIQWLALRRNTPNANSQLQDLNKVLRSYSAPSASLLLGFGLQRGNWQVLFLKNRALRFF
jgi:hypothetical protein